jgi:uncharacterized OsmC-like protein
MALLDEYLIRKQAAMTLRLSEWTTARADGNTDAGVVALNASSTLAGTTGVRPTTAGTHRLISDSAPGLAGHNLGPTAPEMMLASLASCLVHTYVIQAVLLGVPLDDVRIDIAGTIDMARVIGGESPSPVHLENLTYCAHVVSPASSEAVGWLHAAVEENCPVLNTLRLPMHISRVEDESADASK